MTRLLFVDDEPKVLRGIQRLLCDLDCEWDVACASSGQEALTMLAAGAFDVVISDMRMPEMDGAALLTEVRHRHPDVVRIVLSGHSDRQLILSSVSAAHCYLAKPCDPDQLRSVVTRTVALRQVLRSTQLRSLVSRLKSIPSLPQLYQDVVEHLQTDELSLRTLGSIISQDIGMTAKILQMVNSAFFGMPCHVTDPAHAACLLGLEVLKALILTAHIFTELATSAIDGLGLDRLWEHSTQTGAIARRIAAMEGAEPDSRDHAFLAGLLHDTGKLILAVNLPGEYREVLSLSEAGAMSSRDAELQVFGATHAEVGAYLLGIWGLPEAIVEAVAFHHAPQESRINTFAPVTAVHVADAFEHAQREPGAEPRLTLLDYDYLARLQLTDKLSSWQDQHLTEAHP